MALAGTGDVLGDAIRAKIDDLTDEQKKDRELVFRQFGEAIITHLTGPAGAGAVFVISVSGVTSGVAVSGSGTGNLV